MGKQWQFILTILPKFDIMTTGDKDMFFQNFNSNVYITLKDRISFAKHLHHEIEILICTEGTLDIYCNGIRRVLYPGELMIAFPNDIHEYIKTDAGTGYMLIFNPDISEVIKNLVTGYNYENFTSLKTLIPLFQEFYSAFKAGCPLLVMYGYIHIIMGKIFEKLPLLANGSNTGDSLLTDALKYISKNYTSLLSLKTVAKEIGVSQSHLSRVFSEKIPGGFNTYIQKLRVHHACELLKNTSLNMYEVLYNSGFTSQRTFYRVFKAELGSTPKEYKRKFYQTPND